MKKLLKYFIALSIVIGAGIHANAQMGVGISITIGPPPLPVYEQPYCPGDGYMWIPGYWAYDEDGYYWVPGTWVLPRNMGICGLQVIGGLKVDTMAGTRDIGAVM